MNCLIIKDQFNHLLIFLLSKLLSKKRYYKRQRKSKQSEYCIPIPNKKKGEYNDR